jgi:hypothetical protein
LYKYILIMKYIHLFAPDEDEKFSIPFYHFLKDEFIILEKQGDKNVFTLDACDHYIEEIKYFCANYLVNEIKSERYDEAINQSKTYTACFNLNSATKKRLHTLQYSFLLK